MRWQRDRKYAQKNLFYFCHTFPKRVTTEADRFWWNWKQIKTVLSDNRIIAAHNAAVNSLQELRSLEFVLEMTKHEKWHIVSLQNSTQRRQTKSNLSRQFLRLGYQLILYPRYGTESTFSTMQSGFQAGHGCTSATLKVLNDIITAIDKRQYCAVVFIAMAKAFDCQSPHSYWQTQQPWFFKWLPRLVHQLLLRQSSVCQIGGPLVRNSGSLNMGATRFNYLYTSMMSLLLLVSLWSTSTQMTQFCILLSLLWTLY